MNLSIATLVAVISISSELNCRKNRKKKKKEIRKIREIREIRGKNREIRDVGERGGDYLGCISIPHSFGNIQVCRIIDPFEESFLLRGKHLPFGLQPLRLYRRDIHDAIQVLEIKHQFINSLIPPLISPTSPHPSSHSSSHPSSPSLLSLSAQLTTNTSQEGLITFTAQPATGEEILSCRMTVLAKLNDVITPIRGCKMAKSSADLAFTYTRIMCLRGVTLKRV